MQDIFPKKLENSEELPVINIVELNVNVVSIILDNEFVLNWARVTKWFKTILVKNECKRERIPITKSTSTAAWLASNQIAARGNRNENTV